MPIVAATWTLGKANHAPAESAFGLCEEGTESIFGDDGRTLVDPSDFGPGGKYRSIVKLFMHYEFQDPGDTRYAMGTGWLIRPDLLVTAGHCAFDWSQRNGKGFGRATEVKAYIGYYGKQSVNDPNVQFRSGMKIVTTKSWIDSPENRQNDVSFIQLDRPFEGITPLEFNPTPNTGNDIIGVVGYPGDKSYNREQGAQMYEEYMPVRWNLAKTANNMLEYRISTYKGQSGSPVLLQNQNISIGAHVYGGPGYNSASPIAGRFGNPYGEYTSVFDGTHATTTTTRGIQFVNVTNDSEAGFRDEEEGFGDDEEGFWDSLKDVVEVGAPIASDAMSTILPFLGPVGGTLAALAGVAISAAGKGAAESSFDDLSSGYASTQPCSAERAILAESVLQAVLMADSTKVRALGLSRDIMNNYQKASTQTETVGPKLLPALLPTALNVSVDLQRSSETDFVSSGSPEAIKIPQSVQKAPTDLFTKRLLGPTIRTTDEENIWDIIGSIFSTAQTGMDIISEGLKAISSLIPNTESAFEKTPTDKDLSTLAKRALLAESALQAVKCSSSNALDSLEAEDFFQNIGWIAQEIAPAVIKYAPVIVKAAERVITSLIPAISTGEAGSTGGTGSTGEVGSTGEAGFTEETGSTGSIRVPTLRPKRSFYASITERNATRSELLPDSNIGPTSSSKPPTILHANRLAAVDNIRGLRDGTEVFFSDNTGDQYLTHTDGQDAKLEENQDLPLFTNDVPNFEY